MGPEGDLVAARLGRGCRAFGVCLGDEVAAYGWVSSAPEWIGEIRLLLRPAQGEAYLWNCVTLVPHRRRGYFQALIGQVAAHLQAEGLRRVWIAEGGGPAVPALPAAGYRPGCRRWKPTRRRSYRPDGPSRSAFRGWAWCPARGGIDGAHRSPADHGGRQLPAARVAGRPCRAGRAAAAAHPRAGALAGGARVSPGSPGRRHPGGSSRPGAGGDRHRHRRRDPPRELLQPLRYRARGHGRPEPGDRPRPDRASQPGATGGGEDPPHGPGAGQGRRLPPGQHHARHQGHRPRPLHHVAAGPGRFLRGRGGAGAGPCSGRQRGGARPLRRRG